MPITRGQMYQQMKNGTRKKPKKKKPMTKGAKDRAKATAKRKAILSQQRGEGSPQGKLVMRGFVKALYDKVKSKK